MTVDIQFIDRDTAVELQKNESAIDALIRQINSARAELRLSEEHLAAIEEALVGKKLE